ncbi:ABC protein [Mycena sanguinolenta]|uniref:ABC protein n=1 Tax=Mycena sanguinolenta TaxID=230812 RepID=A0A8H7CZ49_9AGAR|nr:ABC protein [Mycena sanguinolenta]
MISISDTSLDDEISTLSEKLRQMKGQRARLSSYRAQTKAIFSPVTRVPPEILAEIFLCTLPPVSKSLGRFNVARSPWLLTQINSHWRAVALSTPSLWSQVVLGYNTMYSLPALDAQIQRAQNLKIYFYGGPRVTLTQGNSIRHTHMFQLLLRHSSRWEELSLGLTSDSALIPILNAHRGPFSSLKKLWINWHREGGELGDLQSIICFQSTISLVDVGIIDIPAALAIHQPQLTHLHLSRTSWDRQLGILKVARDVVEANLTFDRSERRPEIGEIIDLSHLRRLCVSPPDAMSYFKAPALEELAIWVEGSDSDIPTLLTSFFNLSACHLRSLRLSGSPSAHVTTMILQNLPIITELILICAIPHSREVDSLICRLATSKHTGGTMVAPQLRSLSFGFLSKNNLDYKLYLKMLDSRWRAEESRLENTALLVTGGLGPDLTTLYGLRALCDGGLNLVVLQGEKARNQIHAWLYSSPHLKTMDWMEW